MKIILGLFLPLVGTTVGSSLVFFLKDKINNKIEKVLLGFAAGVMIAASIWSLIIPSIDMSSYLGKWSFIPASVGFLLGIFFLLALDTFVPHLHLDSDEPEGIKRGSKTRSKSMLFFTAVTLHNIPEGMAVGVLLAGVYYGYEMLTFSMALALSIGIAVQNLPEGAIISMPLYSNGMTKNKSFLYGFLSGVVEPIFAFVTIFIVRFVEPILPYILSFAAGAMIYVVVEELIPEAHNGKHSNISTISLAIGFVIMMILDIALG